LLRFWAIDREVMIEVCQDLSHAMVIRAAACQRGVMQEMLAFLKYTKEKGLPSGCCR
jgi:hypothetical protein